MLNMSTGIAALPTPAVAMRPFDLAVLRDEGRYCSRLGLPPLAGLEGALFRRIRKGGISGSHWRQRLCATS
jgi:hypothetical protein